MEEYAMNAAPEGEPAGPECDAIEGDVGLHVAEGVH